MTPAELCQQCGACCDGSIFATHRDDAGQRWPQPCTHLSAKRCTIYDARPRACRAFACALLESVKSGRTPMGEALEVVKLKQVKHWSERMMKTPPPRVETLDEPLIAKAATTALHTVGNAHTGEARLRAFQALAQHITAELQTFAAEVMVARGASARAKRADLAAAAAPEVGFINPSAD